MTRRLELDVIRSIEIMSHARINTDKGDENT